MVKRVYCGLCLIDMGTCYVCWNKYEMKVEAKGTQAECDEYFNSYVQRLSERKVFI